MKIKIVISALVFVFLALAFFVAINLKDKGDEILPVKEQAPLSQPVELKNALFSSKDSKTDSSLSKDSSKELYNLRLIYPEDYSFRNGLVKSVEYYQGSQGSSLNLLKKETNYWTSAYPFADPNGGSFNSNPGERVDALIGFKFNIVPRFLETYNAGQYAKESISLALIPRLVAKETVMYDPDAEIGDSKVFGETTSYGLFNLPQIVTNLGWTGKNPGQTFDFDYINYNVDNPHNVGIQSIIMNSADGNLQGSFSYQEADDSLKKAKRDTRSITTIYAYEDDDAAIEPFKMAWWDLPSKIESRDAYGRLISFQEILYGVMADSYPSCQISPSYAPSLFIEHFNCDSTNCIRSKPVLISVINNPFAYRELPENPNTPTNYDSPLKNEVSYVYDDCGNLMTTKVEAEYVDPREEFWTNSIPAYKKQVDISYDKYQKKHAEIVKTFTPSEDPESTPLSLVIQAKYSGDLIQESTNERGEKINYRYDSLGRIVKVWGPYDTEASPSASYEYSTWESQTGYFSGMKIYEKIKIDNEKSKETYYFYDGMGRLIQTQQKDIGDKIIISGSYIDGMGRVYREYRPLKINLDDPDITLEFGDFVSDFYEGGNVWYGYEQEYTTWLEYEYDALGRVVKITDTADSEGVETNPIINEYYIYKDSYWESSEVTDQMGRVRTFTSDAYGNLVKINIPNL